eukprot:scaffold3751_cov188-Prasinococcus_capsulatus_cf.AAC.1
MSFLRSDELALMQSLLLNAHARAVEYDRPGSVLADPRQRHVAQASAPMVAPMTASAAHGAVQPDRRGWDPALDPLGSQG